jgi:hypothetical protein
MVLRSLRGGRFGDQKYLDDWPSRFEGVFVLQNKAANVAPWNAGNYRFRQAGGRVLVDDQPLIFYHFSNLRMITPWLYEPGLRHWNQAMGRTLKWRVYLPYVRELNAARALIRDRRDAGGRRQRAPRQ